MEIIKQKEYYRLGSRTFLLLILQRIIVAIVIFISAFVVWGLKEAIPDIGGVANIAAIVNGVIIFLFLVGFLVLILGIVLASLQYKVSGIMLDEVSFHIVRGMFGKEEVAIPYRRIQGVEIKQSLIYRIFGVAHVAIPTTTSLEQPGQTKNEANEEIIPLIDHRLALDIEKVLTEQAEVEQMEVKS